jgi:hypothetical protein
MSQIKMSHLCNNSFSPLPSTLTFSLSSPLLSSHFNTWLAHQIWPAEGFLLLRSCSYDSIVHLQDKPTLSPVTTGSFWPILVFFSREATLAENEKALQKQLLCNFSNKTSCLHRLRDHNSKQLAFHHHSQLSKLPCNLPTFK